MMKTTKKKMATMFGIASDLSGKIDGLLAEILHEVDRSLAEIAAAHGVLDLAGVGPCSTLGSRIEMLVQERDEMRSAPASTLLPRVVDL